MSEPGWADVPPQVKYEIRKSWINPLTWLSFVLTIVDFTRKHDGLFEAEREHNAMSHEEQIPRPSEPKSGNRPR